MRFPEQITHLRGLTNSSETLDVMLHNDSCSLFHKNNAVSINLSEGMGYRQKNKAPQREPENDVRLSSEYNTGDFIEL